MAAITKLGYEEPTPVQRETIPLLIAGRDRARAGGDRHRKNRGLRAAHAAAPCPDAERRRDTRGLVLVPTRELAMQVAEAIHKYAQGRGVDVVPIYGGASMSQQIRALERGADIVVATPGRALDHLRRRTLTLGGAAGAGPRRSRRNARHGLRRRSRRHPRGDAETRQTALFSATMPARIVAIAQRHLKNPARVTSRAKKPRRASCRACGRWPTWSPARTSRRRSTACSTWRIRPRRSSSAARASRSSAGRDAERARPSRRGAARRHGAAPAGPRDAQFRTGKVDLLVATDVAARGLDIEHLSHVFNYDVPAVAGSLRAPHRPHRARGRAGTAITLAEPREHRLLRTIEASPSRRSRWRRCRPSPTSAPDVST